MKKPIVAPDLVRRPKGELPDLDAPLDVGFEMTQNQIEAVKIGMAIHSASRKPALLWPGWKHVAVAISIGVERALKTSKGRKDTPEYRKVMTPFLRKTGFIFLNKNDTACVVRMLPEWDDIDAWRASLPLSQQRGLNNPREVWDAYDKREDKPAAGKPRHGEKQRRKMPTPREQYLAMCIELELAQERLVRAERETEFLAVMVAELAKRGRLSEETMAEVRTLAREQISALIGYEEPEDE
jgi:hypothetical protein